MTRRDFPGGTLVCKTSNCAPQNCLQVSATNRAHPPLDDPLPIPLLPPPPPYEDGPLPQNHSAIYVHVGKTGGITLDNVLYSNCMWYYGRARRQQCLRALLAGKPSQISEITKATLHFGPRSDYLEWVDRASLFLITLRNPIARVVSAYHFDHPSNQILNRRGTSMSEDVRHFYIVCFPTIQDMADLLELASQGTKKLSKKQRRCFDTARRTLVGQGSTLAASHLRMNYNYYHGLSTAQYPDRPVLVLRTEQLWEDLSRVDRMLGGAGVFENAGIVYTHGSQSHVVHTDLSSRGKEVVCCYLASEMQLYEELLRRAINLFPVEMDATMGAVYRECGWGREGFEKEFSSWSAWARIKCPMSTESST